MRLRAWSARPGNGTGTAGCSSPPITPNTISCNSSPCGMCALSTLRAQQNLDVLNLDDQISTGLHPAVWDTCHRLADAARLWWDDLDAIVYRSRTTPETSVNVAFFAADAFRAESWALVDRPDIMADLVLRYGFTVNWHIAP